MAIKADDRVLASGHSTVRNAHLARIEAFIRAHLQDPDLNPGKIAQACGLSTRYLHAIFADTGDTVAGWIRDQRLAACRAALANPANRRTAAEIAYQWGFSDQAQFSRAFKLRFGSSPRDYRMQARQPAAN